MTQPKKVCGVSERDKGSSKVIVLRDGKASPRAGVTQRDLVELRYLERQMKDAIAVWRAKYDHVKKLVEIGCEVEEGIERVRITTKLTVE
jgi:hypothetical protein